MVVELLRSLALVATVNATPSFDTTLAVVLFKEILMKKLAWLLGAVALVGLSACDTDENNCGNVNCDESAPLCVLGAYTSTGADMCLTAKEKPAYDQCGYDKAKDAATHWIVNGLCEPRKNESGCNNNSDCSKGYVCVDNMCQEGVAVAPKYVRIDDLSPLEAGNKEDPGADIDAIVLTKANKTVKYANRVVKYSRADGTVKDEAKKNIAANPEMALGKPDSFVDYPNSNDCYLYQKGTKAGDKTVDRPFVSLGGKGGYLVVEMDDFIEVGDTLAVYELGKCTLQNAVDASFNGKKGNGEAVAVQISVGEEDGTFYQIGDSNSKLSEKDFIGVFTIGITTEMINQTLAKQPQQ